MIKSIIFDLDGVLIDAKPYHFKALNDALEAPYRITEEEHLAAYDGLPTFKKLAKLTQDKGLPSHLHYQIIEQKKLNFEKYLDGLQLDVQKQTDFFALVSARLRLYVASNSIRHTVTTALNKIGVIGYLSGVFSSEDVSKQKPHPEIYMRAILASGHRPDECLIVEDSPVGLEAAYRSGAHVLRVDSPEDVTFLRVMEAVRLADNRERKVIWEDRKLNVVIPMAGSGKRFADAGFKTPKPLIMVNGKPMIQVAVESLKVKANYIFLARTQDLESCTFLRSVFPGCTIVSVDAPTEGAACTALLAKKYIDNSDHLLIVNSDQYVEYDAAGFFYSARESDASMLTFEASDKKWSYAAVENGLVTRVAEKEVISSHATVGVYYWRSGSDFVKYAEQMIAKNIRVNNEFYVCPVFNEAIADGKKVRVFPVQTMLGLGTPEDLKTNLVHLTSKW